MPAKSQCEAILEYLKTGKSITSWEAIQMFKITRLSGRIWDLRHRGYRIEEFPGHSEDGSKTFARYFLVQEETAPVQEREINYSEVDKQLVIF